MLCTSVVIVLLAGLFVIRRWVQLDRFREPATFVKLGVFLFSSSNAALLESDVYQFYNDFGRFTAVQDYAIYYEVKQNIEFM